MIYIRRGASHVDDIQGHATAQPLLISYILLYYIAHILHDTILYTSFYI